MKVGRKVEECGDESFIIPFIIIGKIFEKNSKNFLLVLKKRLILEGDWALGYNSMKFWEFPDIS